MPDLAALDAASVHRQIRVIVHALCLGVAIFAGIAAYVGPLGTPPPAAAFGLDMIGLLAVVMTFSTAPLAFFLPGRILESARGGDFTKRAGALRTSRILGAALLEGPALLWCVGLLLTGQVLYLVPVAVLVFLMTLQAPTREGFERATGASLR